MKQEPPNPPSIGRTRQRPAGRRWWWAGLLVITALGLGVFRGGLGGAFFFDDEFNILNNESIRSWQGLHRLLNADPENFGVAGRPLLNVSYALNYLLGRYGVTGYHVVNLAIHLLCAALLLAVFSRTFALASMPERIRNGANPLALLVTLVWLVHPIQTNTVTYISQRAESLVTLFYLLALLGLIKTAADPRSWRWIVLAIASGFLGMQVKENMATAPLFLLLYDRAFLAGSWRALWRQRWPLHCGMACIWLLLLKVKFNVAGFGFGLGVDPWHYLLTESLVICRYVGVIFWPPLMVFDYGHSFARSLGDVWPWALLVVGTLGATVWAWRRDARLGFCGAAFFLLLAPTSSVIPFNEMPYAESRLYLPLAVVLAGIFAAIWLALGRWTLVIGLLLIPVLGHATIARDRLFVDEVALYTADLKLVPGNARIHSNLGKVYLARRLLPEAIHELETATRLDPGFAMAFNNLATAYQREGRRDDAIKIYYRARKLDPFNVMIRENLADLLARQQEWSKAAEEYRQLLLLRPGDAQYQCNLGDCYQYLGQYDEALGAYQTALDLDADLDVARNNMGGLYIAMQRYPEAIAALRETLRRDPNLAEAYLNLGAALAATGDYRSALQSYAKFIKRYPNSPESLGAVQAIQKIVKEMPGAAGKP